MARVAMIERTGGPEVIAWRDVGLPEPVEGQVRLRQTAVGLNFIDTYFRSGVYPMPLPAGLGSESVGVVEAIGPGVINVAVGDRVGTFGPERGAYATARNIGAATLFKLPGDIDDETAAAAMLKGCTVEYLVERTAKVETGLPVLVHAAAGGVGLILVQWLKAIGATVIGTVGDDAKADLARDAGADHVISSHDPDIGGQVRALTGGRGVPVVFDGVGMATWDASLKATARRGLLVSYGNAGGPVNGIGLGALASHGSLFVTRPTLFDYYATVEERAAGIDRLWTMIRSGKVAINIGQRYRLEQVAQAHIDLEARKTTGSTVLVV